MTGWLFLLGAIVGSYNVWMTIRAARAQGASADSKADAPMLAPAGTTLEAGE